MAERRSSQHRRTAARSAHSGRALAGRHHIPRRGFSPTRGH